MEMVLCNENPLFFERNFKLLQDIFPKADPDFLKKSMQGIFNDSGVNDFIAGLLENHNYPTKMDALKRKLRDSYIEKYQNNINIDNLCEEIPNPPEYFHNTKVPIPKELFQYIQHRFSNIFACHKILFINQTIVENRESILNAFLKLATTQRTLKSTRRPPKTYELPEFPDISIYQKCFQILAYLEYKEEIDERIQMQHSIVEYEDKQAKKRERLIECQCCYGNDFTATMIVHCKNGHEFCKPCVKKSSEILMMEQRFSFPCLTECNSFFSDETINNVFDKEMLQTLDKKKQLTEIAKAGLEGLEACIHCSFHQLVSPEDKVFECLNPECLQATCRKCLKKEHTPYTCEEITAEAGRHFVENQMSEALISTCWKCGLKFVKIDGCHKIVCPCGARICYFCRKPITDNLHFRRFINGVGCPRGGDTQRLHRDRVEEAKKAATENLKKRVF